MLKKNSLELQVRKRTPAARMRDTELQAIPSPSCGQRVWIPKLYPKIIPKNYPAKKALWGTETAMPTHGSGLPFSPAYFGGSLAAAYIIPPPRRRASPSHKSKGGVCSLHSLRSVVASVVPVTNPFFNGSKGEEQPPSVDVG